MLNSLHLRRHHHLFPLSIPARLLFASPPPFRSEIAKKKVGGGGKRGRKVFTKNDGLKLSCVIIFHALGYRKIDKLEYSGRGKEEGKISE